MYKVVILKNEINSDSIFWEKACKNFNNIIDYRVVDLTQYNWLQEVQKESFDILLAKPSGVTSLYKQLYDERLNILVNELGYIVYPSYREVLIYENKRYCAYWLDALNIPHPNTWIFYEKREAIAFIEKCSYPIVAKINIGASGNGVRIIKNFYDANKYINDIFSKGVTSRTGPKLSKGNIIRRIWRKLTHLQDLKERLYTYQSIKNDAQKGFCLFQEFINHSYEWRVVCIGESYFAHKKIVKRGKASGSLEKEYEKPSDELLNFAHKIMLQTSFLSQAIDVFEPQKNVFLVNEMQCIFGQSDDYQMIVDGKKGRYRLIDGKWIFEEGDYNSNASYNLRIQHVISILKKCKRLQFK